jgi:hypothetical protein
VSLTPIANKTSGKSVVGIVSCLLDQTGGILFPIALRSGAYSGVIPEGLEGQHQHRRHNKQMKITRVRVGINHRYLT